MIHALLKNKKVILASESPRRKEIFKFLGITALQMPAGIEEDNVSYCPRKLVQIHARNKAQAVSKKVDNNCIVVGADTIVYHNGEILGKPRTRFEAADFLTRLSDSSHYVYTGIAIAYNNKITTGFTKSKVHFAPLSAHEIENYIATKEPMDKAGAYGIQGYGSQFVKKISGCYFNIMGFPVSLFYEMIKEIFNDKTIL